MLRIAVLAENTELAKKLLDEVMRKNADNDSAPAIIFKQTNHFTYNAATPLSDSEYDQVIIRADTYTNELHKVACHLLRESCVPEEFQILPV